MKNNSKKMMKISIVLIVILIILDLILSFVYKYDDTIIQIFETILSSGIALTLSLTIKFDVKTDFTDSKIKKSKLSNKVINHCCLTILIQLLMKI